MKKLPIRNLKNLKNMFRWSIEVNGDSIRVAHGTSTKAVIRATKKRTSPIADEKRILNFPFPGFGKVPSTSMSQRGIKWLQ